MSEWFTAYGFADVHDRLLIGAYPLDASDVQTLARISVAHVLNLTDDREYPEGRRAEVELALRAAGIPEVRMPTTDFGRLAPEWLDATVEHVAGWLREGSVGYVHCRAGRQRSAAVAAGAVAASDGIGIDDALALVRRRKPSAEPLPEQLRDLRAWWAARTGTR